MLPGTAVGFPHNWGRLGRARQEEGGVMDTVGLFLFDSMSAFPAFPPPQLHLCLSEGGAEWHQVL